MDIYQQNDHPMTSSNSTSSESSMISVHKAETAPLKSSRSKLNQSLNLDLKNSELPLHTKQDVKMQVTDLESRSKKRNAVFPVRKPRHTKIPKKQSSKRSRSSQSSKSGGSVSSADVDEIKTSLEEHFKAIQSLQDLLAAEFDVRADGGDCVKREVRDGLKENRGGNQRAGDGKVEPEVIANGSSDGGKSARRNKADVLKEVPLESQNRHESDQAFQNAFASKLEQKNRENDELKAKLKQIEEQLQQMAFRLDHVSNFPHENMHPKMTEVNSPSDNFQERMNVNTASVDSLKVQLQAQEQKTRILEEENKILKAQMQAITTFFEISPQADCSPFESKVRGICGNVLSSFDKRVKHNLKSKVDTVVLEELVKHIITKDELKRYLRKSSLEKLVSVKLPEIIKEFSQPQQEVFEKYILKKFKELETRLTAEVEELEKMPSDNISKATLLEIESKIQKNVQSWTTMYVHRQIQSSTLEIKQEVAEILSCQSEQFQNHLEDVKKLKQETLIKDLEECDLNPVVRQLTRDFDEKLYTLCSELSSCKTLLSAQVSQPFYRCAQWIWNSGSVKLGSAVPWNIESTNTGRRILMLDPDNFIWEQDAYNIKIAEAGLYEINLAFFTKAKPSIQLVVNGESVLSAINSPSYVVQHSSGYTIDGTGRIEHGTVTGISLVDFLTLPTKSTLSIHYHGLKKNTPSHGFLGLKRL